MRWREIALASLVVAMQVVGANAGGLLASKKADAPSRLLPLDSLPPQKRDLAKMLADKAALAAKGPAETFTGAPEHYLYFLDHPDRAVVGWRRLGAKCVNITDRGQGLFGWTDDLGSEVTWETIFQAPGVRIWYADGKVRPAALMPLVPVRCLVVLRHTFAKQPGGSIAITHQAELFAHTDSKTATMMTRMLGASAKGMAEQGMGQMQLFFSALTAYLDRNPGQVEKVLKPGD